MTGDATMLDAEFIATLTCPYCRSSLEVVSIAADVRGEIGHGIVRCTCYQYPIVDGIIILRQLSGPSDTSDRAVDLLRSGDVEGARTHLQVVASMVPTADVDRSRFSAAKLKAAAATLPRAVRGARLPNRHVAKDQPQPPVRVALDETRPPGYASYLYQRYANPSFVASIAMMALLETIEKPQSGRASASVLDLACGIGHSTAMMQTLYPDMDFVAADPDYVNLQLLRRHFAPRATCVCLDAELPLPFADDQFDAVFCLDAFHYIRAKWALTRELDRVVDDLGVWIFPHLHNAAVENISPGIPLRPEDYVRMLDFADGVLVDESSVLRDFMTDHVLDLTTAPAVSDLASVSNLGMYGSRRSDLQRIYDIGQRMVDAGRSTRLGINPIYAVDVEPGVLRLHRVWPEPALEGECAEILPYLPESVSIDRSLIGRIASGDRAELDDATVSELIRKLILVSLPLGYSDLGDLQL